MPTFWGQKVFTKQVLKFELLNHECYLKTKQDKGFGTTKFLRLWITLRKWVF